MLRPLSRVSRIYLSIMELNLYSSKLKIPELTRLNLCVPPSQVPQATLWPDDLSAEALAKAETFAKTGRISASRVCLSLVLVVPVYAVSSSIAGDKYQEHVAWAKQAQAEANDLIAKQRLISQNSPTPPTETDSKYQEPVSWAKQAQAEANDLLVKQEYISSAQEKSPAPSRVEGEDQQNCCSIKPLNTGQVTESKPNRVSSEQKALPSHKIAENERGEQLYVFVSFSMPEASLKLLIAETQKHKAILVLNGLINNSFPETVKRLHELGGTMDLNPTLFEEHAVKAVPTFLLVKDGKEIARLQGNVSFSFASAKLQQAGGSLGLERVLS